MRTLSERAQLYGNFWQIVDFSKRLLDDFENLSDNRQISKIIPSVGWAYLYAIIINVNKIFSSSKNDFFRLEKFKSICDKNIIEKIQKIETEHKDIIEKLTTNRNRMVAHMDRNFYKLCFSKEEISRMENDMAEGLRISATEAKKAFSTIPRAICKGQERYALIDLRNDLPVIRKLLEKMEEIRKEALLSDYFNNNK